MRDVLARLEREPLKGYGSCRALRLPRDRAAEPGRVGLVVITHDGEVAQIDEEGERRREELDVERAAVDLHVSLIPCFSPALVEEVEIPDMLCEPRMRADVLGEALAIVVPHRDGGEGIRTRDVVPTPADSHAGQERVAVQLFEDVEQQLHRKEADGAGLDIVGLDGPCIQCANQSKP